MIITSCKDCCFAKYQGKTQINCRIDRLSYFTPDQITEVYDDDKEFYVLKAPCIHYRDSKWGKKSVHFEWLDRLKNEVRLYWQLILNVKSLNKLEQTLESAHQQYFPPNFISCIIYQDMVKPGKIVNILNTYQNKWKINTIQNPDLPIRSALDLCVNNFPFYIFSEVGQLLPKAFIYKLNQLLYWDMKKIAIIREKSDNLMVVNRTFHKHLNGNFEENLENKIPHKYIFTHTELGLCP